MSDSIFDWQFPVSFSNKYDNPVDQVVKLLQDAIDTSVLIIQEDETLSINEGETTTRQIISNRGTVANAGTLQSKSGVGIHSKPEIIEPIFERTPQARHNESRDAVYVWQPTDTDVQRVTADGTLLFRESDVEVLIYVLEDEARAMQLQRELLQFFSSYIDDNKNQTSFNDVQPANLTDGRPENLPRDSGYHIAGITLELNKRQSVA